MPCAPDLYVSTRTQWGGDGKGRMHSLACIGSSAPSHVVPKISVWHVGEGLCVEVGFAPPPTEVVTSHPSVLVCNGYSSPDHSIDC